MPVLRLWLGVVKVRALHLHRADIPQRVRAIQLVNAPSGSAVAIMIRRVSRVLLRATIVVDLWLRLHSNQPVRVTRTDTHRVCVRIQGTCLWRITADVLGIARYDPSTVCLHIIRTLETMHD